MAEISSWGTESLQVDNVDRKLEWGVGANLQGARLMSY